MDAPRLAIFAKAPRRGAVKTRLAADLGQDRALAVYRALLARTAAVAAAWRGAVTLHAAGDDADWTDAPLERLPRVAQRGADLGQRLAAGLGWELGQGSTAIAIGADCPGVDALALEAVAALLGDHDVVFAPAGDGGYWALGVAGATAVAATCASDLPWSQPDLLAASQARCDAEGLRWALGPTRADVDTLADLRRAEAAGFRW